MKRILLIQPKVGSWEFIQTAPMPPLALLSISSYLDKDYDIKIIDQRLDPGWPSTLKEELGKGDVLCVGVTTMTGPQIATIRSPFLKFAFKMYRPIVRLRVRTRFFAMPVEATIFNLVTKLRSL